MLMLLSFPSFFSSFVGQRYHQWITALSAHERNEKYEERLSSVNQQAKLTHHRQRKLTHLGG